MQHNNHKTYYELLGTIPDATTEEINEAYQQTCALYGEDSAAIYSLYSRDERKVLMEEVEKAYGVLNDTAHRKNYDAMLASSQQGDKERFAGDTVENINQGQNATLSGVSTLCPVMLQEPLLVMDDRDLMATEQYRILCTKIEGMSHARSIKAFAITSAVKGEGKSVTSLNLAYIMAQEFDKKVVLVECDFRNPSITAQLLDMGKHGLVDVLKERADLKVGIRKLKDSNLFILPAGNKATNASKVLHSQSLRTVINTLKSTYDYVIIDSPPILPLVDMNILTKVVDGLLLVVRAGKTPQDIVIKAVNSIPTDNLLGIILNGTEPSLHKYYY